MLAPLEAAAECCAAAGARAMEADAHYLRAVTLDALGRTRERNEAARAFRRCVVAAEEGGRHGATDGARGPVPVAAC